MDEKDKRKDAAELVGTGSKVLTGLTIGMTTTAATGSTVMGVISAAGIWSTTATDVLSRQLSHDENRRVSSIKELVRKEFESRKSNEEKPRQDGFFNADSTIRSSADEFFEGILQAARLENQEAKLPYLAHLCVSIAFDSSISHAEAIRLIRQLESLTYRQLCILAAVSKTLKNEWRDKSFKQDKGSDELASIICECFELENYGLLGQIDNGDSAPFYGVYSWNNVVPNNLKLIKHGWKLANLSKLSEIPFTDMQDINKIMCN